MAGNKYIELTQSGDLQEVVATQQSTGASDANKLIALDSAGKLDQSLLPTGIGAATKLIPASENLSAGNFVNFWNDSGTIKCRKADATTVGKEANGFVLTSVTAPANATVYFDGINNQLSSLTLATTYFLNTTAGEISSTAPTASGNIVQEIGKSISDTEISVNFSKPIIRA